MIAVLRRITIIAILFGIYLFIQTVQVGNISGINPRMLIVLGFAILASFTLGEILSLIKLPRVIGYLIIGMIFGPYSDLLFHTNILTVFNDRTLSDLTLVNGVTLSVIALTAGMELKIAGLKESIKSFSIVIVFKIIFIFLMIPAAIFSVSSFVPFLADVNWQTLLSVGLILSVISLGTSIELTLVVSNESEAKGRFIDLILGTTIVKDVVVILLLAIVLAVSGVLLNSGSAFSFSVLLELGKELILSLLFGALWGGIIILYLKYVNQELILFILAAVIFGSELSIILHLETLLAFVTAGFVVQNFSDCGSRIHHPLQKLSLPIFIVFFTVAGASINFLSVQQTLLLGTVLVVIRAIALYLSVRTAAAISNEIKSFKDFGWLGFWSIGGLMLGLGIVVAEKIPGLGTDIRNVITTLVAFNIFLGPILLKIAINKSKGKTEDVPKEESIPLFHETRKEKTPKLFQEPAFKDNRLNKSVFNIIFRINKFINDFDKNIIRYRSEQSVELIVHLIEKYTEEYQNIRKIILTPGITPQKMKIEILKSKRSLYEWFINLCDMRKNTEKNIMTLRPTINELFFSMVDLTDGLHNSLVVDLEDQWLEKNSTDNYKEKIYKYINRLKLRIGKIFKKDYRLTRTIHYRNIAKYFLVGESASELLETVNLVGVERLTTLRKVKNVFEDLIKYFDEFEEITITEKDNIGFTTILLDKQLEAHSQIVNELNIYLEEINRTNDEIGVRLRYALANPFNSMLESLYKAGTYKFNENKLRYSKVFAKSEAAKETALQTVSYWVNYYLGLIGLFEQEVYINKLKVQLNEVVNESLVNISTEINNNLRKVSSQLLENTTIFENSIEEIKKNKENNLALLLKTSQDEFIKILYKHLKELEIINKSRHLNRLLENLIDKFSKIANDLPENILLLEEDDLKLTNRLPSEHSLKSIQIRALSKSFLEKKLPREIGELNELLINHLTITRTELNNLSTIINFHINTALTEIQESDKDNVLVYELSSQLIQKLRYRIESLNQQIDRLEQNIDLKIIEKVDEIITIISKMISDSPISSVDLYLKKESKLSRINNFIVHYIDKLKNQIRKVRIITKRNYRTYFKSHIDILLENLNLKKPFATKFTVDNLFFDEIKLKNLPFIYRKLFDGTPLETIDFFFGKEKFIETITKAKTNFLNNKVSSLIIIGEPGSGKKSLLNNIRNTVLSDDEYLYHQFDKTVTKKNELLDQLSTLFGFKRQLSLDEIILFLNDKSRKKLIIIESINKLFMRAIGGFEALESFVYLVSMTNRNCFWITTINKHTWNYLNPNFELDTVFGFKIRPADFHLKDVSTIVLNRHNATGYGIEFVAEDIKRFKNKFVITKTFKEEQKLLSEKYFKKLEEYSEGNIISGMYYWLQSIRKVKENVIVVGIPKKMSLNYLSDFDSLELLTLSNILIHGWLTDFEHSEMFRITIEKSRDILNYLATFNLIYADQLQLYSNKYFPNKFAYRAIEKELIKRNIF